MRAAARQIETLAERLVPQRTALVVIDLQNDFCHPDGIQGRWGFDLSDTPAMAANVASLVRGARLAGVFIIWIRSAYDEIVQGPPLAERLGRHAEPLTHMCIEGSWGAEWFGEERPQVGDNEVVLTKHRNSAFGHTPIDLYLRANGISTIVLSGTATEGCVDSNARDAYFRDYFIVMASDACASGSRVRHDAALTKIRLSYGEVETAAAILDAWTTEADADRKPPPRRASEFPTEVSALLRPQTTALVIIDVLDNFVPDGQHVSQIARLAKVARSAGVLVVHVHSRSTPQSDSPAWHRRREQSGLAAYASDPKPVNVLRPETGDVVVEKFRESGFVDTRLGLLLRANGITTVVLAGSDAANGIDATARDAAMRDFHVVVANDVILTGNAAQAAAGLEILLARYATGIRSDAMISSWGVHT